MSKRTEAQMYLWDLDREVRRQALAVWTGGPILLLAAGGAGWRWNASSQAKSAPTSSGDPFASGLRRQGR